MPQGIDMGWEHHLQGNVDYSGCQVKITQSSGAATPATPDIPQDFRRVAVIVVLGSDSQFSIVGAGGDAIVMPGPRPNALTIGFTPVYLTLTRQQHGQLPCLAMYAIAGTATKFIEIIDTTGDKGYATTDSK